MSVSEKILQSYINCPVEYFASPDDVLRNVDLSDKEKLRILEAWKLDEEELQVATEENMGGSGKNRLSEVVTALGKLDQ